MPKIKVMSTELVETEVNYVSMVKRGANRIPFRITKEDGEAMLDLNQIGRTLYKKEEAGPSIVAVFLAKTVDVEVATAALVEAGVPADKFTKSETDDAIVLTKTGVKLDQAETYIIKATDDIAFVVMASTDIVKAMSTYDWESTSFSEVMAKGSFCPAVYVATDMLNRTISNLMEKADSPKELSEGLSAIVSEFGTYLTTLAKGLPKSVFKAEQALAKARTAAIAKMAETAKPVEKTEDKPVEKPVEKAADKVEDKKEDAVKTENKTVEPTLNDVIKTMTEQLAKISDQVNSAVSAVKTDVDKISGQVISLADKVKKTDEALSGTVVGDAPADRLGVRKTVSSKESGLPPPLDTGFNRTQNANSRRG